MFANLTAVVVELLNFFLRLSDERSGSHWPRTVRRRSTDPAVQRLEGGRAGLPPRRGSVSQVKVSTSAGNVRFRPIAAFRARLHLSAWAERLYCRWVRKRVTSDFRPLCHPSRFDAAAAH